VPEKRFLKGFPRQFRGKKHVPPEIHGRLGEIQRLLTAEVECLPQVAEEHVMRGFPLQQQFEPRRGPGQNLLFGS
jgi:hypothetical protein